MDELKNEANVVAGKLKTNFPPYKSEKPNVEYGIYIELRKIAESLEKMVKK